MLNVMVTGLLCISMLLVASSCNPCLFIVKFYWNIKNTGIKLAVNQIKDMLPYLNCFSRNSSSTKLLNKKFKAKQ